MGNDKIARRKRARMFYLDHVESDGRLPFEEVIKMDLEGIAERLRPETRDSAGPRAPARRAAARAQSSSASSRRDSI
jgi:hypothetical protein